MAFLPLLLLLASHAWPLSLQVKVDDGPWTAGPAAPLKGQTVRLRVDAPPGASVRWYQLIPDLVEMHKNARFPWESRAYEWEGFRKIPIGRERLENLSGAEVTLFPTTGWTARYGDPSAASPYYRADAGSFWFQAEVEKDGRVTRTPGPEAGDHRGLSPKVMRVSVREGPGLAGWLTSFYNVPALFGSVPYQSWNYIGVDCADALVTAHGRHVGKEDPKNWNVDMLVASLEKRGEASVSEDGKVAGALRWGRDVLAGDFVAVKYPGARRWQHIGLLAGDDGDGVLSGGDAVIHAGPRPLMRDTLGGGAFPGAVAVLRPQSAAREKPIRFTPARRRATEEYIAQRYGRAGQGIGIEPRMVVLHWTALPTLEKSFAAFDRESLDAGRADVAAGGQVNVSAHFLVDRDGTAYRLMPETDMARHVIGLNLSAIGIENVGGAGGRDDLTPAQAETNARLVRELKERHPGIAWLIGHHEYRRFEGHALWKEKDAGYRTEKSDPGPRFVEDVRRRVADLGLSGAP
jgi:hypothetical protein